MKNPPNIDWILSILLTKKQRAVIAHQTACGSGKTEALRELLNLGIAELERQRGQPFETR